MKLILNSFYFLFIVTLLFSCAAPKEKQTQSTAETEKPKIVNIINFIRLLEPRSEEITEDVLFQTVVQQVEMMKKYHLGGTFLLQYDALMDSRYQELLKSLPDSSFEIGGWFEIPQPLVENAGMKWRGRYPWDWHADVGFATGYTPEEREKLVDVYMKDFKTIFGYYPKSMGCWFIDAHSLEYMYEKYGIVASCNCKDQVGTDGYTMWGGYWNQAYYPSRKNAYMPAQNSENQIHVPIFRMLGSDPIYQYDDGLGNERQGVVSLEPVYEKGGGDSTWVNWYFRYFVEGESLEYAYVQVGQENSFTWERMEKGFEIQLPLIAQLRDENKVKVETLAESGEWFKKNYQTTPATSVSVLEDLPWKNKKTLWFNSRFYRSNLLWQNSELFFRDIQLFDENMESLYLNKNGTSNQCLYFALPFVDGYFWSNAEQRAGLRFKALIDREEILLKGDQISTSEPEKGTLQVDWNLNDQLGTFSIKMNENNLEIQLDSKKEVNWFLDLNAVKNADLPFVEITPQKITAEFKGMRYAVAALKGEISIPQNGNVFRMTPKENTVVLNFSER
ncbi:hypothetical protein GM418_03605 [Maribellus comscasis]|uniref:Uncharacterized protein n=1 Tax=Maribellus comscasis TaxID=2681766 RepID=A0A6I6JNS3_9BACT|nr:hypothetical protein [Maribellus comscasis]QGY42769.1 hypothetical protein GM418_03605 [Maribellus comscasis]